MSKPPDPIPEGIAKRLAEQYGLTNVLIYAEKPQDPNTPNKVTIQTQWHGRRAAEIGDAILKLNAGEIALIHTPQAPKPNEQVH